MASSSSSVFTSTSPYLLLLFVLLLFLLLLLLLLLCRLSFFSHQLPFLENLPTQPCDFSTVDSSSTASAEGRSEYDVFLSFRGQDTRDNFTSHLYAALKRKQILTFIDDTELKRGEEISPSLLKAIQESKIAVIVFSPNYASSKWCLEELASIIECKNTSGQIVIPVFYHVDPSHVRNQTGSFADAFAKHEQVVLQGKLQKWKAALKESANLSGWDSSVTRPETKLIDDIVVDILEKLSQTSPQFHPIHLVGIESHTKNVELLLCLESPKVLSVGIWGMGGIGKTTVAKTIFHRIYSQFEGFHFAENFKEDLKRDGIVSLSNKIFGKLLGEESLYTGTLSLPLTFTLERLRRKKVLIIFDDVDGSIPENLKELLIRKDNFFGPGSKILVTSRDKQVLKNLVDEVYKVDSLKHGEALNLFSLCAFKKEFPPNNHIQMSNKVVDYANGNPLAIKVLGSALFDKSKDEWDSALDKLEEVPKPGIMNVLRISYDELSSEEKNIFLDIAFFWKGKNYNYAAKVLGNYYDCIRFIIGNLNDKSLITISHDNKLDMHDLLQEMSFGIVREKSITNPGQRSRLCNAKDIHNVLTQQKGTEAIEGISLDLSISREMHLVSDAFRGMTGLRFLKFYNYKSYEDKVHLPRDGLQCLPNQLSYFRWDGFPSKSLPLQFCAENLVQLILRRSKVKQLWTGVQNFVNLKEINLFESLYLSEIPNLSKAKNIEHITLEGCVSLDKLPSSIQYLEKLEYLNAEFCGNLRSIPRKIDSKFLKTLLLQGCRHVRECPEIISGNLEELGLNWTAIKEIPKSIHDKLKYLRGLGLHGSNITKFPELSRDIGVLTLTGTAIEEVPSSIGFLARLTSLILSDNKKLLRLPSTLCQLKSLECLIIDNSPKLESFPEILEPMESLDLLQLNNCSILEICSDMISMLPSLSWLDLRENNFESLPENIRQLHQLRILNLSHCKHLRSLPELPSSLYALLANDCESLETFPSLFTNVDLGTLEPSNCLKLDLKASLEMMYISKDWGLLILPGSEIPKCFSHRSIGSSLTLQLPQNGLWVKKITFCSVITSGKLLNILKFAYHGKAYNGEQHDGEHRLFYEDDNIYRLFHPWDPVNSLVYLDLKFKSDHLLVWSSDDYELLDFASKAASIEFDLGLTKRVKVQKCAVHVHYRSDSDEELVAMREDSKLKRDCDDCFSNDAEPSGRSDNPNMGMRLLPN